MNASHAISPNLGNPSGSVGIGDEVPCGGVFSTVAQVVIHPAGAAPAAAPIVDTMLCVEVITSGGTRWLGAKKAWIGADLRVHWLR